MDIKEIIKMKSYDYKSARFDLHDYNFLEIDKTFILYFYIKKNIRSLLGIKED